MVILALGSCSRVEKPRVAIVGIAIECSTFSPARTTEEMFRVSRGDEMYKNYPFLSSDSALVHRAEWFPAMYASATPGGMVTRAAYESLVGEELELLRQNLPYDGIFLDIHGAMSVEGLSDPEADYVRRIREVVGGETLISACMDTHGCVSKALAEQVDIITCYRMAPHEDRYISKKRAVVNLLDRLESGKGKPKYKAWVYVPILLPGEKTSTRVEPGASLFAAIDPLTKSEGVIDAAIWVSYAWADESRNHAVVTAVGDNKDEVIAAAELLARKFWDYRDDFEFVAPTASLEECLAAALASDKRPYFISDMGDNPTAGGAGDVSWTLAELLKREEFKGPSGKRLIYASIPAPELVAAAIEGGVGSTVKARAGAMVDDRYAGPVEIEGVVERIVVSDVNSMVVVRVGSIQVIATQTRKPFHYERDFDILDLNPRAADIIVVKLGYLTEELFAMRGDWMMALTRGGVDQDLEKLPYKGINRPMYPLDSDMDAPALKAVLIGPSGQQI